MSVSGRRLIALAARDRHRRRHPAWLLGWPLAGAIAAAALGLVSARAGAAEARAWWVVLVMVAAALVALGGPFRLYWRRDAVLLARLPIEGGALYRLCAWDGGRAALGWLVIAAAARPSGILVAAATLAAAAMLAPAAATLAGVIVASARTQAVVQQIASGQAPPTASLSILPAVAAAAAGTAGWLLATRGADPVAGALLAGALLAFAGGARLARAVLAGAMREVVALDAVKLAHVDLTGARGLERLWGRLLARGGAWAFYRKDAALMRRRYPLYYVGTGIAVALMWAGAIWGPRLAAVGATLLVPLLVLFARSLRIPPTEQPRLVATLPIAAAAPARAKAVYVAWRALWPLVVGTAPLAARALL